MGKGHSLLGVGAWADWGLPETWGPLDKAALHLSLARNKIKTVVGGPLLVGGLGPGHLGPLYPALVHWQT